MLGVCDRAALTKPCGNTRGASERREERGCATDGQSAAALERQPANEHMRNDSGRMPVCRRKQRRSAKDGIRAELVVGCYSFDLGVRLALLAHSSRRLMLPLSPHITDTPQEEELHFQSVVLFTAIDPATAQLSACQRANSNMLQHTRLYQ